MQEWIERQEIGLYSRNGYVRGAYARFWHFCAVLAQPYANLRALYARPTYTYATVRLLYAILRVGTPISYALPTHKVRNRTPSYASLRRSCDFFMSTQPEYADNFGVEVTRDYATLRGHGVKGVLVAGFLFVNFFPLY